MATRPDSIRSSRRQTHPRRYRRLRVEALEERALLATANTPPSGQNHSISALEDTAYVFSAADFPFTDTNGNSLAAVKIATLPAAGALQLNGTAVVVGQTIPASSIAASLLKFVPVANANGAPYAAFGFQVKDNGGTAIVNGVKGVDLDATANTLTINVLAVSDAPKGADNTITALEDSPYTFKASDFPFTDNENNALAAVSFPTIPGAGSLMFNGVALAAGGLVSADDLAAGKLSFAPPADANGTPLAAFTFQVKDNGGNANGGVDTDATPNALTINVTSVNDPPAGVDRTIYALPGAQYRFSPADFGFTDPNDNPANGFVGIEIVTVPTSGTLDAIGHAAPGAFVNIISLVTGDLTYTPPDDASGDAYASFTFRVADIGGTDIGGNNFDATPNTMTFSATGGTPRVYVINYSFATGGGLDGAVGMAMGADGLLYVSSANTNNVLRYDAMTGTFAGMFASGGGLQSPQGLTFGPDGNLYVASAGNNSILRYDKTTGAFLNAFVTSGSGGLASPDDLLFGKDTTGDGVGELLVSSPATNQILRYNGKTGAFIDVFVSGHGLNELTGFTQGPDGNLYVSNHNGNSVLRFNGSTGAFIDAFLPAYSGGLVSPRHLCFGPDSTGDGVGELYVSSGGYSGAIMRYDGATGAFLGSFVGFGGSGGGLTEPYGALLVRADGKLLAASGGVALAGVAAPSRPMTVLSSNPAAGATLVAPPTDFVLNFSNPYDSASVQAGDFIVNGIPADSFAFTDADKITFHYNTSPVTEFGSQTMVAGGISTSVAGAQNPLLAYWYHTFQYAPPMAVTGSNPAAGATVSVPPTDFVIDFSDPYDLASVQASDLVVNGVQASTFIATDADTITFHYNTSPVTANGLQTMAIAAGAISTTAVGPNSNVAAWNQSFELQLLPLSVTSSSPGAIQAVSMPPTDFMVGFSHGFDPSSIQAGDFTVNGIGADSFVIIDSQTIKFHYSNSPVTAVGLQSMSIAAGAIADPYNVEVTAWNQPFQFQLPPLLVTNSSPADGAAVIAPPNDFVIGLSLAFNPNSVQAGDLAVNGINADSFVVLDSKTISFHYNSSPVKAYGQQSMSMVAGTMTAGSDPFSVESTAWNSTFTYAMPPSGAIAWWTGDGTAADSIGSNDGILEGGVSFAPGMVGQAFSLDGIDDRIRVPNSAALNPAGGFTIEGWIKSNRTDGPRAIVSKWNDNTSDWSYIFKDHNSSDKLRIELSKDTFHDLADLSGAASIVPGQWTHVAMTYDTSTVRLYYNGVLDGSQTVDPAHFIDKSATDLLIGAVFTGGGIGEFFSGLIDEVALYNRALSGSEIQLLAGSETGQLKPMVIAASTPADGAIYSAAPTDYAISFSFPYDPSSAQPSDFTVNGIPATSLVPIDDRTLAFHFDVSPVKAVGVQTMHISAGAITTTASGASSPELAGWSRSFQVGGTVPVFERGTDLRVFAEDGGQNIVGWATQIRTTFADKPPALASFKVSNSNSQLFAVSPKIDSNGLLSFQPTPNSKGAATVTVVLSTHTQGEEGGEVDSDSTTFTIDVLQEYPLQNDIMPEYVDNNLSVTATDVLLIINYINAQQPSEVSPDEDPDYPYLDVSGDDHITAIDVLDVINYINANPSEGQGEAGDSNQGTEDRRQETVAGSQLPVAGGSSAPPGDLSANEALLLLLASDAAEQAKRRLI